MADRLSAASRRKYRSLAVAAVHSRYGKGPQSAWAHMSQAQRDDVYLAGAALIVLAQAESTARVLTLADAQEILRACVDDD